MTRREPDFGDLRSWALRLANRGWDAEQIARDIWRGPAVAAYVERFGKHKAEELTRDIGAWAVETVRLHPVDAWRAEVPARIAAIRDRINAAPIFNARTAPTDYRATEVLYLTAVSAGSTAFRLSMRTGGVRGGMAETTFCSAVKRLRERGVVHRLAGSWPVGRVPARYRIGSPVSRTGRTGGKDPSVRLLEFPSPPIARLLDPQWRLALQHDAFRPAALGDLGWLIVHRMNAVEPLDVADLSQLTGVGLARLRRVARQLSTAGILVPGPDGWTAPLDVDPLLTVLERIARESGTSGALEADRTRHAADRAEFDNRSSLSVPLRDADDALALLLAEPDREVANAHG